MADIALYCNSFATASGRRAGKRVDGRPWNRTMSANREMQGKNMPETDDTLRLPPTFNRLAWSNLAAQSAEQIALAAAPIVAVLMLGGGGGQTGPVQTPRP